MIFRICKSILLFFGRIFEPKRRQIAILPEIDPMAPLEEVAEQRRMKAWGYGPQLDLPGSECKVPIKDFGYGSDFVAKETDYIVTNLRV